MKKTIFKYIYGPVSSWRLGRSLGVDLITKNKVCTFDCAYCQVGPTKVYATKRKVFVPAERVLEEIKSLPKVKFDYITLSGVGEPTLAKNLAVIVRDIKKIRKEPVAVLTNSSLLNKKDVRDALKLCDFVIAKLDASSQDIFEKINAPAKGVTLEKVIEGIKKFRKSFRGRFALQIMFVKKNLPYAKDIAALAREIKPDQVQINTPTRPCGVKPLSRKQIIGIKKYFKGLPVISVYEKRKVKARPIDKKATLKRRPEPD